MGVSRLPNLVSCPMPGCNEQLTEKKHERFLQAQKEIRRIAYEGGPARLQQESNQRKKKVSNVASRFGPPIFGKLNPFSSQVKHDQKQCLLDFFSTLRAPPPEAVLCAQKDCQNLAHFQTEGHLTKYVLTRGEISQICRGSTISTTDDAADSLEKAKDMAKQFPGAPDDQAALLEHFENLTSGIKDMHALAQPQA